MDKFTNPELFEEMTRLLKAVDAAGDEGPGRRWMKEASSSIPTADLMKTPMAEIKSAMIEKKKGYSYTAAAAPTLPTPSSVESSRCRVTSAMWVQDKYPEYRSGKSNARDQLLDALKRMKFRLAEEEAAGMAGAVEPDLMMLTPVGRNHVRLEKMVDIWSNELHREMREFLEVGGYESRKAELVAPSEYESLTLEGAETPVESIDVFGNKEYVAGLKKKFKVPVPAAPKDQESLDDAVNFETNPEAGSW